MLPASARLRASTEFAHTVRRGVRAGRPTLVMHATRTASPPTRVGFVVSKAVGNAVVRNRVKRRLRHLVAPLVTHEPPMRVVVRALPPAADEAAPLADDVASAWATCVRRLNEVAA